MVGAHHRDLGTHPCPSQKIVIPSRRICEADDDGGQMSLSDLLSESPSLSTTRVGCPTAPATCSTTCSTTLRPSAQPTLALVVVFEQAVPLTPVALSISAMRQLIGVTETNMKKFRSCLSPIVESPRGDSRSYLVSASHSLMRPSPRKRVVPADTKTLDSARLPARAIPSHEERLAMGQRPASTARSRNVCFCVRAQSFERHSVESLVKISRSAEKTGAQDSPSLPFRNPCPRLRIEFHARRGQSTLGISGAEPVPKRPARKGSSSISRQARTVDGHDNGRRRNQHEFRGWIVCLRKGSWWRDRSDWFGRYLAR